MASLVVQLRLKPSLSRLVRSASASMLEVGVSSFTRTLSVLSRPSAAVVPSPSSSRKAALPSVVPSEAPRA